MGIDSKVQFAINGSEVVDIVKETFQKALSQHRELGVAFRPIDLVILDYQMPFKNGGEVYKEIVKSYDDQADLHPDLVIEEPMIVLLTAYASHTIKKYAL